MNEEIMNLENKGEKKIKELIHEVRGKQVMLDTDIASLFGTTVSLLNRQMVRNLSRFPNDFCFQLTNKELSDLRCQNGTAKLVSSKRRYNPYVYTEQGIIVLAGVLKSDVANQMCVKISRVFVKMRSALIAYQEQLQLISRYYGEFIDFKQFVVSQLDDAFNRIEKLEPKKEVLLLSGEYFDAFEAVIKLIERAKESIVLVDPYLDDKSLVFLSHRKDGVKITLYKSKFAKLKDEEVEAFSKQYGDISVREYNESHNRYLILDCDEVYDLGYSLNKVGSKIFTISKMEIKEVRETLIKLFK